MGKKMGISKPLARSSATFDAKRIEDDEPYVYKKNKGLMPKKPGLDWKKNPKYQSAI